jgi:A/G-specific adenine glycosylase
MSAAGPRAFPAALLAWYEQARRDLPWRRSRDPWAIWVSEVMLQQTRVEAVRDAFVRFVAEFPTPASLAAAGDAELLRAWRGLGYYRRARLLRDAARIVVAEHGGRVPEDPDALAALPGIGGYTRGAIASIAFGQRLAAIDGNVERVVSRLDAIDDAPAAAARRIRARVDGWLAATARAGDFNQALMELGATICVPRAPRCADCPVAAGCVARATGRQQELPRPVRRPAPIDVTARAAWIEDRDGRLLARRLPPGAINAGQWELPGPGALTPLADPAALGRWLAGELRVACSVGAELARVRHAITRHRVSFHVHAATLRGRRRAGLEPLHRDDPSIPWTTLSRKVFASVARGLSSRAAGG